MPLLGNLTSTRVQLHSIVLFSPDYASVLKAKFMIAYDAVALHGISKGWCPPPKASVRFWQGPSSLGIAHSFCPTSVRDLVCNEPFLGF